MLHFGFLQFFKTISMKKQTIMLAVLLAASYSSFSSAGVLRDDKSDSDWEILLAPYLWGTSLEDRKSVV